MDYNRDIKCAVCRKGFTKKSWEDRHDFHDVDCPRKQTQNVELFMGEIFCDCNLIAHERCCPDCHPKEAQRIRENQVLRKFKEDND